MHKIPFVLFILVFLTGAIVYAQTYYADVTFDVTQTGEVIISGTTNHPLLQPQVTQGLTQKTGSKWDLSITLLDEFSEYIYTIKLPNGAELISVNTSSDYRINSEEGRIVVIGMGQETKMNINVKYEIAAQKNETINYALIIAIIIIIIFIGGLVLLKPWKGRKKETKSEKPKYNKEALTERQLQIVEHLEKAKKGITQAQLQKEFKLPKASLSRNLEGLEKKGIITKERKGMTMLVTLKRE